MGALGLGTEKRGQSGINSQVATAQNYCPTKTAIISGEQRDEIKVGFETHSLSCPRFNQLKSDEVEKKLTPPSVCR